jgi:heterodisulfide reductase subunit A-like polyferredoxin
VLGGFVPASNDRMETSQAGVYVCGSAAGIAHVDSAVAEGRLAGAAAAASLGFGSAQIVRTLVAELHACDPERVAARSQVLSTWRQHTIEAVRAGGAS